MYKCTDSEDTVQLFIVDTVWKCFTC